MNFFMTFAILLASLSPLCVGALGTIPLGLDIGTEWEGISFPFGLSSFLRKGFCGDTKDYTVSGLQSTNSAYGWYDPGPIAPVGICWVGNNGGIFKCQAICAEVDGCKFFSVSTTAACYACFIHKTCPTPSGKPFEDHALWNSYTVWAMPEHTHDPHSHNPHHHNPHHHDPHSHITAKSYGGAWPRWHENWVVHTHDPHRHKPHGHTPHFEPHFPYSNGDSFPGWFGRRLEENVKKLKKDEDVEKKDEDVE